MKPLDDVAGINWIEVSDSTNYEVRRRLPDFDNLSIVAARAQTAGRGQGDHTWYSSPGKNLTFSILFRFDAPDYLLRADEAVAITHITTLALHDYLLSRGIVTRIKWPNDIWAGDRKICGILIENTLEGNRVRESITGIGLNVNETGWPDSLPNPVSMKELTGRTYDIGQELEELYRCLKRRYAELATAQGREALDREFSRYMFRLPEARR